MLPSLRSLFLDEDCIKDDDFKDLRAGCPQIEDLHIFMFVNKLGTMVVSNPTLKLFALNSPRMDCEVLIESKNLESLEFSFVSGVMCELEITPWTTVRNLTLYAVNDEHMTLMHFINEFPLLEKLVIFNCINLPNLSVSHRNLASFDLRLSQEVEVKLDAPKLKSLKYEGGFTSFPGIEASQELECVQFDLNPGRLNDRWYIWLRNILESVAHSKHLSLICPSEQVNYL
ncbi:hypothetical protein K7X08_004453 [Anisodus acutangulus]|uniref:Uncharacterized protein n=1 Tax=Anisodus acutangulus TaxID=402998 RepID=A0A9Q1MV26_9SOLA|nr:hypothetical protein K7X08_004453 [Anisodus acutangulus]